MKILHRLLTRWADSAFRNLVTTLEREVADLQAELQAEKLKTGVVEGERDNLAAVVARDRERIKAEGAAYARQRAEAEGVTHEQQRDCQGVR